MLDRMLPVALLLFIAFVIVGGLGGWQWFLNSGDHRATAAPLETVQHMARLKTNPGLPF